MENIFKQFATLILFLAVVVSCGKDTKYVGVLEQQKFEGVFFLNNNSTLELIQASDNDVTFVSSGQILTSVNPQNDSLCQHPTINGSYELHGNSIKISRNFNYTSGNDVETDVSGSNITGNRRTDITITKVDGKLQMKIEIYDSSINNNANSIVATREFNEQ